MDLQESVINNMLNLNIGSKMEYLLMNITKHYINELGFDWYRMPSSIQFEIISNSLGVELLYKYEKTGNKRYYALANLCFKKSLVKSRFLTYLSRQVFEKTN